MSEKFTCERLQEVPLLAEIDSVREREGEKRGTTAVELVTHCMLVPATAR